MGPNAVRWSGIVPQHIVYIVCVSRYDAYGLLTQADSKFDRICTNSDGQGTDGTAH